MDRGCGADAQRHRRSRVQHDAAKLDAFGVMRLPSWFELS